MSPIVVMTVACVARGAFVHVYCMEMSEKMSKVLEKGTWYFARLITRFPTLVWMMMASMDGLIS